MHSLTIAPLHSFLFPFIPENAFKAQLPALQSAVGALPNFRLKLHSMSYFKHGSRRFVLILKPEESVRIILRLGADSSLPERGKGQFVVLDDF